MKFIRSHLKLSIKLLVILILLTILILFVILKTNQGISEWWTTHFVSWYLNFFGHLTKYIPFSLTEIVMIGVIILSIVFSVFCLIYIFKKKWSRSLHFFLNLTLVLLSVFSLYQVTAEMAYNREPLNLNLYGNKVEKTEFRTVIEHFIGDLNDCCNHLEFKEDGDLIEPMSHQELNQKIEEEYAKYDIKYLLSFTTRTKPMITSFIYREFHITGLTFMPTAEANVNTMNVASGKPFTYAHELAHTKGSMREADADLIAAYITLQSDNYYLRYSGYYYTLGSLLNLAKYTGVDTDYKEVVAMIDTRYKKNVTFNNNYWDKHNSWANFANWWNNLYLKISGVKEGTGNYGDNTPTVNPTTKEITSFSNYQKLYFTIYYS
ncbi:MAG: DUF3810 domain-containing protein [Bacilli bacterium]|nr:DUF3810 domain-containing protein [Bacilli bacterium]